MAKERVPLVFMEMKRSKKIKSYIATVALAVLSACSSVTTLNLQTNPSGADVYIYSLDGANPKKLGVTPLLIPAEDALKVSNNIGPVVIEFRKDGFIASKSMVTDLAPADVTVSAELQRSTGLEDIEALNKVIDRLFESQRLVRAGRLDDAMKLIEAIQKDAPELSALYEIQGGIFYLQKKPEKALDSYQTSIRFNPKNVEAVRMRNYLMSSLGVNTNARTTLPNTSSITPNAAPVVVTPSPSSGGKP